MANGIEWPDLGPALLFAVAVLTSMIGAVVVSGHFPRQARQSGTASDLAVVALSVTTLAAAIGAVLLAFGSLPWYAAVILGGLAVVSGPLLEQRLPVRLRATSAGVAALSVLELAIAAICLSWAGIA